MKKEFCWICGKEMISLGNWWYCRGCNAVIRKDWTSWGVSE